MTIALSLYTHKKIVLAGGLMLAALLIGLYIFQLNYLTTLAYHISENQEQLTQLKYENASLQATTFQSVSLKDLHELAAAKSFEKVGTVTYLKATAGPVAQQ
jgi:uncharacterized membrane protein (Fun14 family)